MLRPNELAKRSSRCSPLSDGRIWGASLRGQNQAQTIHCYTWMLKTYTVFLLLLLLQYTSISAIIELFTELWQHFLNRPDDRGGSYSVASLVSNDSGWDDFVPGIG